MDLEEEPDGKIAAKPGVGRLGGAVRGVRSKGSAWCHWGARLPLCGNRTHGLLGLVPETFRRPKISTVQHAPQNAGG